MKIFDADKVKCLIDKYNSSPCDDAMTAILEECTPLVNYYIKLYNAVNGDDMRQDALIKIMKSVPSYNPKYGNTHTYISRVIRNSCITHFHKDERGAGDCDFCDEISDESGHDPKMDYDIILSDLMKRNTERFPSISKELISAITESIYSSFSEGLDKGRTVVRNISNDSGISRDRILSVYSSTLIYLRMKYGEDSYPDRNKLEEFSLEPEMVEILGKEKFCELTSMFAGVIIHL